MSIYRFCCKEGKKAPQKKKKKRERESKRERERRHKTHVKTNSLRKLFLSLVLTVFCSAYLNWDACLRACTVLPQKRGLFPHFHISSFFSFLSLSLFLSFLFFLLCFNISFSHCRPLISPTLRQECKRRTKFSAKVVKLFLRSIDLSMTTDIYCVHVKAICTGFRFDLILIKKNNKKFDWRAETQKTTTNQSAV
jgi:hypothetical protein